MSSGRIEVDPREAGAPISRRLFGTFVEHMGRSVYDGIYEPGHPTAGPDGFREDVLELVRELGGTLCRYPGGNFVSGYRWEDGVGPVDERPVRRDPAWHSIETNRVGLHEFADWAERAGLEIVEAVNLGTRGIEEAGDLLEYANHPGGTELSERRRRNGRDEPFGIRVWCLGNEMDGPWQIGHKTAEEYGRLAAETGRLMKLCDPRLELVVAGSSNRAMPTYGEWERTVLRHTAGIADHLSLHLYVEEIDGDATGFLASGIELDAFVDDIGSIVDEVADETGTTPLGLSIDEWNVWYNSRWNAQSDAVAAGEWLHAPRLIEDEYSVTDAIVLGALLVAMVRNADRISMANLAQLVNVIAPIRTEPGGPAWRQTTYFPFQLTSRFARGRVVPPQVTAPSVVTAKYGDVAALDCVASVDDDGAVSVFVVHRGIEEALPVELTVAGDLDVETALVLAAPDGGDRHTTNTVDAQTVEPVELVTARAAEDGSTTVRFSLPAPSWAVLTLRPRS
ncbi:alpha-N-arabinofuranosidase [Isoptericola croceus]|uniref:alpha-N-arabinofuranosidase n=1 Tax=Isoptericola croceus TaxID=3031406 RepID=UPI0023FA4753|nr:alpha-L-arabinofuranosidase C-terminal domain-containing protein [Isoptericola croceus]